MSITITVEHIATGRVVKLNDFALTEFSDSLTTNWNKQEVYGRMDPIMNYQGTGREISLGVAWKSLDESKLKGYMKKVTQLMSFQYPTYVDTDNALAIQSPPLLRVSFANLISKGIKGASEGLVCAMNGISYTPQVGFTPEDSPMIRYGGTGTPTTDGSAASLVDGSDTQIIPKSLSIKFKLTILHEHSLGWHFNGDNATYGWMGPANGAFGPRFIQSTWSHFSGSSPPAAATGAEDKD